VSLLRGLGYTNVRHYPGGISEWTESGGPVETTTPHPPEPAPVPRLTRITIPDRQQWGSALLDVIERRSTTELFILWLAMVAACGVAYWGASFFGGHGLVTDGAPLPTTARGLLTAVYFSFVTATSVGYGDVVPVGALRWLAVAEAAAGLLTFGAVVSKFVSRRQDELVREIHRVTFEERLDRVQTNLHLVLSELQAVATLCEQKVARPERLLVRLESVALVFAGELRAVHDLLYRPQQRPNEAVLEAILASLASALREFAELLGCLPSSGMTGSSGLDTTRRTLARLAEEICGECVPRAFAPALTGWMNRVQEIARRLR
jgi:potassium channel LctB